jgi:hypothetical protein
MARHRGLLLGALCALAIPFLGAAPPPTVVGPSQILYTDADSVYFLRSAAWLSEKVRHEEKLLLRALRLKYWSEHLPPDMSVVYRSLGYPLSRVLATPVGHSEEWWYYKMLEPPLRFRDGILLDPDRFEAFLARR